METKEEALLRIKTQMAWLGWDDEKCLEFYNQKDKPVSLETEETCPTFIAYYTENETTGRRAYKIVTEDEFIRNKTENKAYDYKRFFNESKAKEWIDEKKDEVRHEANWDRYMNT